MGTVCNCWTYNIFISSLVCVGHLETVSSPNFCLHWHCCYQSFSMKVTLDWRLTLKYLYPVYSYFHASMIDYWEIAGIFPERTGIEVRLFLFFSLPLLLLCLFEKKTSGHYCSTQTLPLNANWYQIRSEWLLHDNLIDCWIIYYFLMVEAVVIFLNDQRQTWIQMTNFYDRLSLFLQQKWIRWTLVLVAFYVYAAHFKLWSLSESC